MQTELKVTSPEDYAGIVAKSRAKESELVKLPSGAVWRLCRADMEGLVLVGSLPQSLTNAGLRIWAEQGKPVEGVDAQPPEITDEETEQGIVLMRQTVLENCLEPRLGYSEAGALSVLNRKGEPIVAVAGKDMTFAFNWITGQEGLPPDGLSKSGARRERRAAASQSRRRKVRA